MTTQLYVRLRAGGEQFAVPVEEAREVVVLDRVSPVPGAHDSVLGVCNLRGRVLSLLEVAAALGLPRGRPARALVVEVEGHAVGLAVDGVDDVVELPEATHERQSPLISGSALVDGDLVGVLDLGAIVATAAAAAS